MIPPDLDKNRGKKSYRTINITELCAEKKSYGSPSDSIGIHRNRWGRVKSSDEGTGMSFPVSIQLRSTAPDAYFEVSHSIWRGLV